MAKKFSFVLLGSVAAAVVAAVCFGWSFKNQGPLAHASCYQAEPAGSLIRWMCEKALFDVEWPTGSAQEINEHALISMASGHAATNPQEADKLVDLFLRRVSTSMPRPASSESAGPVMARVPRCGPHCIWRHWPATLTKFACC